MSLNVDYQFFGIELYMLGLVLDEPLQFFQVDEVLMTPCTFWDLSWFRSVLWLGKFDDQYYTFINICSPVGKKKIKEEVEIFKSINRSFDLFYIFILTLIILIRELVHKVNA